MSGDGPPRADPGVVRALQRAAMSRAGEGRLTLVAGPDEGGDARRLGRSMLPTLAPGQEIEWCAVERTPRVGEVVVFEDPGVRGASGDARPAFATVVHRVVGVRPDGRLVTKGDNRATADPEGLDPGDVIGVLTVSRDAGRRLDHASKAARAYGRVAAFVSSAGDAVFRAARLVDTLVGGAGAGAAGDWSRTLCARRIAWLAQRGAQLAWHAIAHRACHRRRAPGEDA